MLRFFLAKAQQLGTLAGIVGAEVALQTYINEKILDKEEQQEEKKQQTSPPPKKNKFTTFKAASIDPKKDTPPIEAPTNFMSTPKLLK